MDLWILQETCETNKALKERVDSAILRYDTLGQEVAKTKQRSARW